MTTGNQPRSDRESVEEEKESLLEKLNSAINRGDLAAAQRVLAAHRDGIAPTVDVDAPQPLALETPIPANVFEELFREIADPVFLLDPREGRIVEVNDAAVEMLQFSREELLALSIPDIHPFEMERFARFADAVLTDGHCRARGLTCRNRSGFFIPAEISASRVKRGDRNYILASVRDVRFESGLNVSEPVALADYRSLQDQLATTQYLIHHAPEMILWVTPSGRVTYANQTAADTLGIQCSQLQQMRIWDLDVQLAADEFPGHVEQFRQGGRVRLERKMRHANGEVFPVSVTAQLVRYGSTEVIFSFSRDISEEVRARDEARRYLSELAQVSRQTSISEMASAISHEIDQPLTAMLTLCRTCMRMLQSGEPDVERLERGLTGALKGAERIHGIVERLRDYMRSGEPLREPAEIADLIDESSILIRAEARHNEVELAMHVQPGLPAVEVDRILIQQVILNLARNGIEAMVHHASSERRLVIQVERDNEDGIVIGVSDTGPGVSAELAGRLFEPFFGTKGGGLGIGLSLCRSIIDSHGGRLWLDDPILGGATFCFSLPSIEPESLTKGSTDSGST